MGSTDRERRRESTPSPEVTGSFCRVPSTWFSRRALVYSTCEPVSVWGTVSSTEGSPPQFEVLSWKCPGGAGRLYLIRAEPSKPNQTVTVTAKTETPRRPRKRKISGKGVGLSDHPISSNRHRHGSVVKATSSLSCTHRTPSRVFP